MGPPGKSPDGGKALSEIFDLEVKEQSPGVPACPLILGGGEEQQPLSREATRAGQAFAASSRPF